MLLQPIKNCYWAVPGKLLAGEYPINLDEKTSLAKLRCLKEGGVTAFIDLTEANEPARGAPLRPYSHLLDSASHRRFPIRDGSVPDSPAQMTAILDAIDRQINAGATVYVHCWGFRRVKFAPRAPIDCPAGALPAQAGPAARLHRRQAATDSAREPATWRARRERHAHCSRKSAATCCRAISARVSGERGALYTDRQGLGSDFLPRYARLSGRKMSPLSLPPPWISSFSCRIISACSAAVSRSDLHLRGGRGCSS